MLVSTSCRSWLRANTHLTLSRRYCSVQLPLQPSIAKHVESLLRKHATLQAELETEFSTARALEIARLDPVVMASTKLRDTAAEAKDLAELVADITIEAELRDLADQELAESEASLEEQRGQLMELLVPPQVCPAVRALSANSLKCHQRCIGYLPGRCRCKDCGHRSACRRRRHRGGLVRAGHSATLCPRTRSLRLVVCPAPRGSWQERCGRGG